MKKAIVSILALVLVLAMAVPASAANTPAEDFMVSSTAEGSTVTFFDDAGELTAQQQAELEKAQASEQDAAVDGMDKNYMFYFSTSETAVAVFRVPGIRSLVVKQFVDGKWTQLESVINNDGTITVKGLVSGPVLVFAIAQNKVYSPTAPLTDADATSLLPVTVTDVSSSYALYSVLDSYKLSVEARQVFEDAQNALKDAVPAGMAARYFFYVCTDQPCTLVLDVQNCTEVVVKQYVDGAWVTLDAVLGGDGTVTIENVVEGPMAVFTK